MAILRTLLISLILLVTGLWVLSTSTDGFRAYTSEAHRLIEIQEHPKAVPPLPLQTSDGGHTSFGELQGRWLLVDFFYSRCMTFCSLQGDDFAHLQNQLAEPIAKDKVLLLSISFDLAYDDPKALSEYLRIHNINGKGWIAARPVDQKDLTTLMQVFGVVAVPDGFDGFVHNAAIAVVNPEGKLVSIFDWNDSNSAVRYITERMAQ